LDVEKILLARIRTIANVPVKARPNLTRAITKMLWGIMSDDVSAWNSVASFWKVIFWAPHKRRGTAHRARRRGKKKSSGKWWRTFDDRLKRWINGDFEALVDEFLTAAAIPLNRPSSGRSSSRHYSLNDKDLEAAKLKSSIMRFVELGRLRDAAKVGTDAVPSGPVDYSAENEAVLRGLHPDLPEWGDDEDFADYILPNPREKARDSAPINVDEVAVKKALFRFPRGSSGSMFDDKPQFWRDAAAHDDQGQIGDYIFVLTKVVNKILKGDVPPEVEQLLKLFGLPKKDTLRPIACGTFLRRLVGKVACAEVGEDMAAFLESEGQVAMSKSGAHALRLTLASLIHGLPDPGDDEDPFEVLFIDLRNAFNLADRRVIIKAVSEFCPGLLKYVFLLYGGDDPLLHWFDVEMHSKNGVQQGDPLGPLLFSLSLVFLTRILKEQVPGLLSSLWFADDGTLVGRRSDLMKAFRILSEVGPKLGFHPNAEKFVRFGIGGDLDLPISDSDKECLGPFLPKWNTIPCVEDSSDPKVELLGAPLNAGERISNTQDSFISRKVTSILTRLESLNTLLAGQPHAFMAILRNVLGVPGVRDLIATCPTHLLEPQLKAIDDGIRSSVVAILDIREISVWEAEVAQLPSDLSGLGIGSALLEAQAAFVGTVVASKPLRLKLAHCRPEDEVEVPFLDVNLDKLKAMIPSHELDLIDDEEAPRAVDFQEIISKNPRGVRSRATRLLYEAKYSSLLVGVEARKELLLRVGREPGARAAVGCVPNSFLGTGIPAKRFRRLLRRCLGLPIFSQPPDNNGRLKCLLCDDLMDVFGDHAVSCSFDGLRTRKHNNVRDILEEFCRLAGFYVKKEEFRLVSNGWQRPADLRVANWVSCTDAWFDVSVVNTHAQTYFAKGLREFGAAARTMEKSKETGAKDTASSLGVIYKPMVFTCWGGSGDSALFALRKLAFLAAERNGDNMSSYLLRFRSKIAISIALDNARSFERQLAACR
jgi:hypothetical protein